MNYNVNDGAKRVVGELKELAGFTADENGAQRVAWTPTWQKARDWFREKAEAAGAEVSIDGAGNQWARLEGETKEGIAVGSHLDCVPNGGPLDGALGVVAGLEVLRRYAESGTKPKKTIYAVNWADEEGARFGYSCLGSSAASGSLNVGELMGLTDINGVRFEDALREYGVESAKMLDAGEQLEKRDLKGYLELHIEQGPVLENAGKVVSCVYGAAGVERHNIEFTGQASHAGSFPTQMRQDAFLAAAQASLAFKEIALKYNAVCTVGQVRVEPCVVTIVPGKCVISLDQRTIKSDDLPKMLEEAKQAAQKAADDQGVSVKWSKICAFPPQLYDDHLIELCKKAVEEETGEAANMYSGPLHDAVEAAKKVPAVMMFVMSEGGLSHTKEEYTPDEKIESAVRAFLNLADKVVDE
ncbi:MAG: Zn-dependent hydrolase [Muricomes sp.]